MIGLGKTWPDIYKEKDMSTNVALSDSGLLHRDQDILDYYLLDEKKIQEIADLTGLAHKNQVSTRLEFYRKGGLDIPGRGPFGKGWANGKKKQKRVVLTQEHLAAARDEARKAKK